METAEGEEVRDWTDGFGDISATLLDGLGATGIIIFIFDDKGGYASAASAHNPDGGNRMHLLTQKIKGQIDSGEWEIWENKPS